MKNWRIILPAILLLIVSMSCSVFTGSTSTNKPSISGDVPKSSGLIEKVTMAKNVESGSYAPVDPTTVFGTTDTVHAVVQLGNAPTDTQLKAAWYTVDIGSTSQNNKLIDTSEYTSGGPANVDFYLTPSGSWPTGTYEVEIYVNGTLDQVIDFSVK